MANFEDRIIQNINSLIYLLRSHGVKALSTVNFLLLLNKKYRVELDEQDLEDVLSNNKAVTEIIDDKIIIDGQKQDEEDDTQDEIHDTAVDQAGEKMTSESKEYAEVINISETINVGDIIPAKNIVLNENDNYYFIHKGARASNVNYVVKEIKPCLTLNESSVLCQIEGKQIKIDIPLKAFKK